MITEEIKEFLKKSDEYEILTFEEILHNINNIDFTNIGITEGETWKTDNNTIKFLYNDYNTPIVIKKDNIFNKKRLYINPKWYKDNKEKCNELFKNICEFINKKELIIETSEIINSEIIDSLCKNKHLEEVTLAKFDEEKYILSEVDYQKFKNSTIKKVDTVEVADSLKENFDPLIGYNERYLISCYNYQALQQLDILYIWKELSEEEINNLKYIPNTLTIKCDSLDYSNLSKISTKLHELNKQNKVILRIENKEIFNSQILNNNIDYDNIVIKLGVREYPLKEYLKFEKILYDFVNGIEHLSPFEKYIYIYNITKKYKTYKENEKDKSSARDLYEILTNEYMVCAGFSEMLGDLLNKQNIENSDLSVTVDLSYDRVSNEEEHFEEVKLVEKGYHARRYVHIKDEKYGIDGFYIADPTWDNHLELDLYNYLAMTPEEASNAKRYIWNNTYTSEELLNVHSIEEYYQKINFLTSRINKENDNKKILKNLISEQLTKLDKEYVVYLKEKYKYIEESKWPEDINDLIYEAGEYIVKHTNKEIPGEIIIEAVSNVYKKAYGYSEEECEKKMQDIIKINKEKYQQAFPIRYRINEDGSKEVIMNFKNKFDIEYKNKVK